jgi:hypothetical protein
VRRDAARFFQAETKGESELVTGFCKETKGGAQRHGAAVPEA